MTWILFLLLGGAAGVLGGLFGIGGGVIIVPVMVLLMGFTQHKAQGTSLGALLLPVGLLGFLRYHQEKNVDLLAAGLIAGGFFLGTYFGANIAQGINEGLLRKIFAGLLFVMAVQLFLKK